MTMKTWKQTLMKRMIPSSNKHDGQEAGTCPGLIFCVVIDHFNGIVSRLIGLHERFIQLGVRVKVAFYIVPWKR